MKIVIEEVVKTEKTLVVPPMHTSKHICSQMACGSLNCAICIFNGSNYDTFRNLVNSDEFYVTNKETK